MFNIRLESRERMAYCLKQYSGSNAYMSVWIDAMLNGQDSSVVTLHTIMQFDLENNSLDDETKEALQNAQIAYWVAQALRRCMEQLNISESEIELCQTLPMNSIS